MMSVFTLEDYEFDLKNRRDIKTENEKRRKKREKEFRLIKELPSWFNLENYQRASQLDLEEWITQIWCRQLMEDLFYNIVFTGVIDDFRLPEAENLHSTQPVTSISVYDGVLITEAIKKSVKVPPEIWQAPYFLDPNCKTKSLMAWSTHCLDKEERNKPLATKLEIYVLKRFAHIDLDASDAVLITSFKKWLKKQREITARYEGRTFSKAILHRWALNQVLPYIDLMYWAYVNEVKIPHWLMGEALFPGYSQGDKVERVRKTTEPNAEEVMNSSCLYSMLAELKYKTGKSLDLYRSRKDLLETKSKIFVSA